MNKFRDFLINESSDFLSTKVGEVLDGLQSLQDDAESMKTRELTNELNKVVGQIRKILHGTWDESSMKNLKSLQKVGVALAKTSDGDASEVRDVLDSAIMELQGLLSKDGNPINRIAQS
jgi:hypothetical protein